MFAIVMFGGLGFGVRGLEFGDEGFRIELLASNSNTVSALVERSGRHLLGGGARYRVQRMGVHLMCWVIEGMHARKHHGVLQEGGEKATRCGFSERYPRR